MNSKTTLRALTQEELATFKQDGFLFCKGLFNAEEAALIAQYVQEIDDWPEVRGKYCKYFEEQPNKNGERQINRIENYLPYHDKLNALINSARIKDRCADLLGEDVVLFKDKINFKKPGGSGFKAHQDIQAGWDDYVDYFLSVSIAVDKATVENGCLEVASGFHTQGIIGEMWKPMTYDVVKESDYKPYPMDPGDVIIFDCYAPHQSKDNHSDLPRRNIYLTYNGVSQGDHLVQYYADKRKSFPPDFERDGKEYKFRV